MEQRPDSLGTLKLVPPDHIRFFYLGMTTEQAKQFYRDARTRAMLILIYMRHRPTIDS